MFKVQYKARSPYDSWITVGSYSTESQAISAALGRKNRGALLVRVINKKKEVVFTS